jgi:hypothetical protein
MAYPTFTAGDVMDISAALLNDPTRTVYTYTAQIPYLKLASQELQEYFQQNDIPVVNKTDAVIPVTAGTVEIGFVDYTPAPNLPDDLVDIQRLWTSETDQENWIPMTKRTYIPAYLEDQLISLLTYWAWKDQKIVLLPSNANNDIKIDYIATMFPAIVDENTQLKVINAQTFLQYRTAGLCAQFIGENPTRAAELNADAVFGSDRATGIATKGTQSIPIRRRPFRAGYKTSGGWGRGF